MNVVKSRALRKGDTIAFVAPSFAIKPEYVRSAAARLESMGFSVKFSEHLFSAADGYAGSVEERAEDFNAMIADPNVRMLLFGGGEVCNEILPYVDYESIRRNPKILASYSDSTTILDAVTSLTGLVTFYGCAPRTLDGPNAYNLQAFEKRLMSEDTRYLKASPWRTICPGQCEGVLTGGYLVNYASLVSLPYFRWDERERGLLFLEDHEMFSSPAIVSKWLSHLEQLGAFERVSGLIFGHYSNREQPQIDEILRRVGARHRLPVVKCEDFGHGAYNAILPIGVRARLNADTCQFTLLESGVRA